MGDLHRWATHAHNKIEKFLTRENDDEAMKHQNLIEFGIVPYFETAQNLGCVSGMFDSDPLVWVSRSHPLNFG